MLTIDLTQPVFDRMPVYPGDPDVTITHIHTIRKEGWNLRSITMTTHTGTHVNVPCHMVPSGKSLDNLPLNAFFGQAVLYTPDIGFERTTGVIFSETNITMSIATELVKMPPKFIGLSEKYEFDIEVERYLLENGIISYENLTNTDKLPERFLFYGIPLRIRGADGSPVRAFATIDTDDEFE